MVGGCCVVDYVEDVLVVVVEVFVFVCGGEFGCYELICGFELVVEGVGRSVL